MFSDKTFEAFYLLESYIVFGIAKIDISARVGAFGRNYDLLRRIWICDWPRFAASTQHNSYGKRYGSLHPTRTGTEAVRSNLPQVTHAPFIALYSARQITQLSSGR